jgi:hypothetical protein
LVKAALMMTLVPFVMHELFWPSMAPIPVVASDALTPSGAAAGAQIAFVLQVSRFASWQVSPGMMALHVALLLQGTVLLALQVAGLHCAPAHE